MSLLDVGTLYHETKHIPTTRKMNRIIPVRSQKLISSNKKKIALVKLLAKY